MKYILLSLLFLSCSQVENKTDTKGPLCDYNKENISTKHIVIATKAKASALASCYKNFIKFEEDKTQLFNVCHRINIAKSGQVTYSRVYGIDKEIPKDLAMCLEQQLWMFNYKNLYLEQNQVLEFPLIYKFQ